MQIHAAPVLRRSFCQGGFDGFQKEHGSIFAVIGIRNVIGRLRGVNLCGDVFQRRFHQRIHGCGGFA